jgi:hypothetical protein
MSILIGLDLTVQPFFIEKSKLDFAFSYVYCSEGVRYGTFREIHAGDNCGKMVPESIRGEDV